MHDKKREGWKKRVPAFRLMIENRHHTNGKGDEEGRGKLKGPGKGLGS